MMIEITQQPFDPWRRLSEHRPEGADGDFGATAVFVGTMRDFNDDESVQRLFLEHYPGMAERYLERISEAAAQRWALLDSLIVHRVGALFPGEPIVLVAAWSAHRSAAFEACRYLINELKSQAPFWKKEQRESGSRWVSANTPD